MKVGTFIRVGRGCCAGLTHEHDCRVQKAFDLILRTLRRGGQRPLSAECIGGADSLLHRHS